MGELLTSEPVDVERIMAIAAVTDPIQRNQRITLAYEDLASRLEHFIGGPFANWCTYAVWSSRTVGGAIAAGDLPLRARVQLDRLIRSERVRIALERRLEQGLPTTRRTVGVRLAAGNRDVFLEVARAVTRFLDHLGRDVALDERRLQEFLATVEQLEAEHTMSPADVDHLREGLAWYYRARFASTGDERSEQVLAGSLLIGIYEQTRLQRPIEEAFALGVDGLLSPLERRCGPRLTTALVAPTRQWLTPRWARLMTTRTMTLRIDGDLIRLGSPLAPPPGRRTLYPTTLQEIALPRLVDLLHEIGLDDGAPVVARDWSSYGDRMRFIGAFFRSRQQVGRLFTAPDPEGRW